MAEKQYAGEEFNKVEKLSLEDLFLIARGGDLKTLKASFNQLLTLIEENIGSGGENADLPFIIEKITGVLAVDAISPGDVTDMSSYAALDVPKPPMPATDWRFYYKTSDMDDFANIRISPNQKVYNKADGKYYIMKSDGTYVEDTGGGGEPVDMQYIIEKIVGIISVDKINETLSTYKGSTVIFGGADQWFYRPQGNGMDAPYYSIPTGTVVRCKVADSGEPGSAKYYKLEADGEYTEFPASGGDVTIADLQDLQESLINSIGIYTVGGMGGLVPPDGSPYVTHADGQWNYRYIKFGSTEYSSIAIPAGTKVFMSGKYYVLHTDGSHTEDVGGGGTIELGGGLEEDAEGAVTTMPTVQHLMYRAIGVPRVMDINPAETPANIVPYVKWQGVSGKVGWWYYLPNFAETGYFNPVLFPTGSKVNKNGVYYVLKDGGLYQEDLAEAESIDVERVNVTHRDDECDPFDGLPIRLTRAQYEELAANGTIEVDGATFYDTYIFSGSGFFPFISDKVEWEDFSSYDLSGLEKFTIYEQQAVWKKTIGTLGDMEQVAIMCLATYHPEEGDPFDTWAVFLGLDKTLSYGTAQSQNMTKQTPESYSSDNGWMWMGSDFLRLGHPSEIVNIDLYTYLGSAFIPLAVAATAWDDAIGKLSEGSSVSRINYPYASYHVDNVVSRNIVFKGADNNSYSINKGSKTSGDSNLYIEKANTGESYTISFVGIKVLHTDVELAGGNTLTVDSSSDYLIKHTTCNNMDFVQIYKI